MTDNYIFTTEFKIGEIVKHKLLENELIVTGFTVLESDQAGNVTYYNVLCTDGTGEFCNYKPNELEKVENYIK